jgi:hypothetical protein
MPNEPLEASPAHDEPLQPNWPLAYRVLHGEHLRTKAQLEEAEQRIKTAEERAAQTPALHSQIAAMMRANVEFGRQRRAQQCERSIANKVPVAGLLKKLPKGIVSKQAVHYWCIDYAIDAAQIDGHTGFWYVDEESFWRRVERVARRKGVSFVRPT